LLRKRLALRFRRSSPRAFTVTRWTNQSESC